MRSFLSFVIAALLAFVGSTAHADTCDPAGVVGNWTNGSATLSIQPSGNNFAIGLNTDGGNSSSIVSFNRQECSFGSFRSPGGRETLCRFQSGNVYCSNPRQSNMRFERSNLAAARQTPIPRPAPQQSAIRVPANQPQHASCVPELLALRRAQYVPRRPVIEVGAPSEYSRFLGAFVGKLQGTQCFLAVIEEIRADGTVTLAGARGLYTYVVHGRGSVEQGNHGFRYRDGRIDRTEDGQLRLTLRVQLSSPVTITALLVNDDLLSFSWNVIGGLVGTGFFERVDFESLIRHRSVAQIQ